MGDVGQEKHIFDHINLSYDVTTYSLQAFIYSLCLQPFNHCRVLCITCLYWPTVPLLSWGSIHNCVCMGLQLFYY